MSESYDELLYDLQKHNKTPLLAHLLPNEHQIHEIDLKSRTINVPQFLSVRYDHNAEVVYFKCDRYFEGVDLADTVCVIQYINADGDQGIYWVPYYDIYHYDISDTDPIITTPKILIPWSIGGLATITAGTIQFSVRFYLINDETKKFIYNLSTKPAEGEILHGLDLPSDAIDAFRLDASVAMDLYQKMFELAGNSQIFWKEV